MTTQEAINHLHTYSSTNGRGQTTQNQHEEAKRMARAALEKQIPQKPVPDGYKDKWPVCGLVVKVGEKYCKHCGVALDWKVGNDD